MQQPVREPNSDVVSRAIERGFGGRMGSHAVRPVWAPRHVWANPLLWCGGLIAAWLAIAVVFRNHCLQTDFSSPGQFRYACYSDIPANVLTMNFSGWLPPLWDSSQTTVVGSLGATQLLWLTDLVGGSGDPNLNASFGALLVLAAFSLVAMCAVVARLCPTEPWRPIAIAASPLLLTSALISFETVAGACAAWGLYACLRGRSTTAGVLSAIAALIVPALIVCVPAVIITAWRRSSTGGATFAAAGAAVVLVMLHVSALVASPEMLRASLASFFTVIPGYGGLWYLPTLADAPVSSSIVRVVAPGLYVGWLVGLVVWAARRPAAVHPARFVVLGLTGYVVLAASSPVQAAVWLLPFAVVSVRRFDVLAVWMLTEVFFAMMTWQFIYSATDANKGAPEWVYASALLFRAAAWIAVAVAAALQTHTSDDTAVVENPRH